MDVSVVAGFDWDDANRTKCQKHGVTMAEIEAVFRFPHHVAPDIAHSRDETRFLGIGKGIGSRSIFVVFTLRENSEGILIRPISARYMHRKEIEHYEETTSAPDQ